MSATKRSDLGAGLNLSKPSPSPHPGGPIQHGALGQGERAFSAASTFLSGVLAISASQLIGAPLKLVDPKFYDGYMAWTKESFAVLVTNMTQWWAPTVVRVTGDDSMKGQLFQMDDGSLRCNFPHRMVLMANHQLYTDWLYLWWIAYTNKMHGRIYIILKESLKNVPIFGWGAQFYNFIFLARKWETDKPRFKRQLAQLADPKDPMWLLIFPEGTNLSATTREKSKAWAQKQGIPDMKHQLLPRSTGLHFCLDQLKQSTNWLYDCTIAYEGVPKGQFGQDIFTLRSSLFEGRPPKSVNMYWRRWKISDIPLESEEAFAMWLRNRWTEKDYLLEHFARHKTFPEGDPVKAVKQEAALQKFASQQSNGDSKTKITAVAKSAKFITTEVRANGMEEFMGIFGPVATAATALSSGQLTPENIDFDALLSKVAAQQGGNLAALGINAEQLKMMAKMQGFNPSGSSKRLPSAPSQARRPSLPSTASPTAGRNLDPEVSKAIEDAHAATRQRLEKASGAAAAKNAPNVRKSIPMTPMETFVTRPLSTIAMQRAAQSLSKAGPALGAKKDEVLTGAQRKATQANAQAQALKKNAGVPAGGARPAGAARRESALTVRTVSSSGSEGKAPVGRKAAVNGAAAGAKTAPSSAPGVNRHPLAGQKIKGFKGHTPVGQKKV